MKRDGRSMLSSATKVRLYEILDKIANGKEISLTERVYVDKYADKDQDISLNLRKAKRLQIQNSTTDSLDKLLNDLELENPDPDSTFKSGEDDLGEWFKGAPSWLARS